MKFSSVTCRLIKQSIHLIKTLHDRFHCHMVLFGVCVKKCHVGYCYLNCGLHQQQICDNKDFFNKSFESSIKENMKYVENYKFIVSRAYLKRLQLLVDREGITELSRRTTKGAK